MRLAHALDADFDLLLARLAELAGEAQVAAVEGRLDALDAILDDRDRLLDRLEALATAGPVTIAPSSAARAFGAAERLGGTLRTERDRAAEAIRRLDAPDGVAEAYGSDPAATLPASRLHFVG